MNKVLLLIIISLLVSCSNDPQAIQKPDPIKLGRDDVGYYMQMIVADHAGPKAQLWLSDQSKPLWFVDVRDAILFKRTPEEADNISAIYAHDMAKNPDYNNVKDIWLDIEQAFFVIGSQRKGGMGMPEAIPFSEKHSARDFVAKYGGEIIDSINQISTEYLTSIPGMSGADPSQFMKHNKN
ncbi:MAG: nitrous oxide reductase accessory protein NosL [Alcanivoracaceae bacterium]|nr:nitrous oxide reductase accessory protein NosL [Alcanivoracaceae bacterium]